MTDVAGAMRKAGLSESVIEYVLEQLTADDTTPARVAAAAEALAERRCEAEVSV